MRILATLLLAASALPSFGREPAIERVDLDKPGALQWLKKERPQHYRILADAPVLTDPWSCGRNKARTINAHLKVRASSCGGMMLTSYPPKHRYQTHVEYMIGNSTYLMSFWGYEQVQTFQRELD